MTDYSISGPEHDLTVDWTVVDRHYTGSSSTFTKRQCTPAEQLLNNNGEVATYPFTRERLENERDALKFIAQSTTIPVPRIIAWSDIDGIGSLTVETIPGKSAGDIITNGTDEDVQKVKRNVESFMTCTVLPQLARLRSKRLGQLGNIVIPPPRVTLWDHRPSWPIQTSSRARYIFCHNDLSLHNVLVDPNS